MGLKFVRLFGPLSKVGTTHLLLARHRAAGCTSTSLMLCSMSSVICFGLPDFYNERDLKNVTAIMNRHWEAKTIKTDEDIAHLYAIYARHERH